MKKVICIFLIVATAISFFSCGSLLLDPLDQTTCDHDWNEATCTTPKTCSKCNETRGEALGHTSSTGPCSRCGQNFGAWEIGEFIDEFEEPTGVKYIGHESIGTFSNSATTDSNVLAYMQITATDIAFMLWEYESYLVEGYYGTESYSITILDQNKTKHYFSGTLAENDTRIYVQGSQENDVIRLLKNNSTLKVYIEEDSSYATASYLFTIDTTGFSEAYSQIQ